MQENEELQDKVTFFSKLTIQRSLMYMLDDNPPRSIDVKDIGRQLSERKRLEEAKRKEDRVLRRSLRQSERLRQLAKAKRVAKNLRLSQRSADNLGFDDGEFELSGTSPNMHIIYIYICISYMMLLISHECVLTISCFFPSRWWLGCRFFHPWPQTNNG